jgi:hypothetical protein
MALANVRCLTIHTHCEPAILDPSFLGRCGWHRIVVTLGLAQCRPSVSWALSSRTIFPLLWGMDSFGGTSIQQRHHLRVRLPVCQALLSLYSSKPGSLTSMASEPAKWVENCKRYTANAASTLFLPCLSADSAISITDPKAVETGPSVAFSMNSANPPVHHPPSLLRLRRNLVPTTSLAAFAVSIGTVVHASVSTVGSSTSARMNFLSHRPQRTPGGPGP